MNKKILKFGKMVALFLVAMSCSKDNSSKDEVLPHAEERISSITLENLPQSIKEKLKEQIATDVFLHLQEEVTIIENEDGIKTYSVGMKQGADIEEVMKNKKTISFIKKSPCNKIYGGGASTFNTIIINNSAGGFGMPTYVNSVNHGDYIETSFTNLNDGKTSVTWTPNPYSPKFKNGNWRNKDGFFEAFFEGMWSGIKILGNGINSIGRDVKNLFKGKHCGCRPRTRRPAEGSPAYVYTTDFIQEKLCCDEEINFMMPTHFLQSMPKPINLTQDDCDCALQNNPSPFVFDESEYVLLREEDKTLLNCACSKGNTGILLEMLHFDLSVISTEKIDTKFFNEICSFLKESNYTSEAFAFAKEAVIAKEKGGSVDFPNRIIYDVTFLNSQTACIHQKMDTGKGLYSEMLSTFYSSTNKSLTFKISNTISTDWGITNGNEKLKNHYTIILNKDIIENNGSNLMRFVTLCHELIHAYMFDILEDNDVLIFDSGDAYLDLDCPENGKLNGQNVKERFVNLICAMNKAGTLTPEWSHELFNSKVFSIEDYRNRLQKFIQEHYDWDSETVHFTNNMKKIFGNDWKQELAKGISWVGLEKTEGYNNYINAYSNQIAKILFLSQLRNKISQTNKKCK